MTVSSIQPFIRFVGKCTIGNTKTKICPDSRLFYVLSGSGKINVNGVTHSFAPDTVVLWQAGTKYSFYSDKSTTLIVVNFDFDYSRQHLKSVMPLLNENEAYDVEQAMHFDDCEMLSYPIVCQGNVAIKHLLEKMIREDSAMLLFGSEQVSVLMKSCIIELVRINSSTPKNNAALEAVIEYIRSHYNEDINNHSLAALVNYHPHYLNKIFLQANGITLHQYIVNYRLVVAKTELISGNAPMAEIALSVGFGDPSSFSYAFKKSFGMTPMQYRRNARKLV